MSSSSGNNTIHHGKLWIEKATLDGPEHTNTKNEELLCYIFTDLLRKCLCYLWTPSYQLLGDHVECKKNVKLPFSWKLKQSLIER
jgi:hypothetical protein